MFLLFFTQVSEKILKIPRGEYQPPSFNMSVLAPPQKDSNYCTQCPVKEIIYTDPVVMKKSVECIQPETSCAAGNYYRHDSRLHDS